MTRVLTGIGLAIFTLAVSSGQSTEPKPVFELADIHLSPRTKQWDTCAPEVILSEAGGRMTDLFGEPLGYNNVDVQNRNGLVASNGAAHHRIIEKLAPLLEEFGRMRIDVGG